MLSYINRNRNTNMPPIYATPERNPEKHITKTIDINNPVTHNILVSLSTFLVSKIMVISNPQLTAPIFAFGLLSNFLTHITMAIMSGYLSNTLLLRDYTLQIGLQTVLSSMLSNHLSQVDIEKTSNYINNMIEQFPSKVVIDLVNKFKCGDNVSIEDDIKKTN